MGDFVSIQRELARIGELSEEQAAARGRELADAFLHAYRAACVGFAPIGPMSWDRLGILQGQWPRRSVSVALAGFVS